jgi:hypothetical protein
MRTIKTSAGTKVTANGDLLAIVDVLFHEVTATRELERSFEDMTKEIANLVSQMTPTELRGYLQEALFVTTITYENQRAAAYIRSVGGRPARTPAAASRPHDRKTAARTKRAAPADGKRSRR